MEYLLMKVSQNSYFYFQMKSNLVHLKHSQSPWGEGKPEASYLDLKKLFLHLQYTDLRCDHSISIQ